MPYSILCLLSASTPINSQTIVPEHVLKGYTIEGSKVSFIFDEEVYKIRPEKVVLTGAFRNWDHDMDHPDWLLKKKGNQWLLTLDNDNFATIAPNTKFKFRINDGQWMEPPAIAENKKGSDLVFLKGMKRKGMKAEIKNNELIWAEIEGERPLSPSAYIMTDASGKKIEVSSVLPNEATTIFLKPAEKLDKKRVYFLEVPSLGYKVQCSFDGWFRETFSTKELGANIENGKTTVRLFAPRAEMVKLYLYKGRHDKKAYNVQEMTEDSDGVWEFYSNEDLHGVYYDFTIHGADDPGNHFYEINPVHITDPYARVSDDTWGKGRIWRKTKPATPIKGGRPKMQDVIAYEVHVQDFSDLLPVADNHKGTFKGMMATGLKNKRGEPIGFDYLLDLGINVLHLMPVQEYVHFPTNDWKASFKDDEYMIDQGVNEENYQWGYRTSHAMAIESRYRSKDKEPGAERDEFRDLVQAFHDRGIAVIIDIVPNHTAENMDGNEWYFNFNAIDKQYYYRTKDFDHIGEYGNEVKTENRPMVQRWLIDQCRHFIEEFGIDGFRVDLAGQIDKQTLKALKEALGEDIILYGEPWIGSSDPAYEENPSWDWYKADAPITFFQDETRNAFKGPVFELRDKYQDRGWPGGKYEDRDKVMLGLANKFADDKTPLSGISYLDIHDNFTLADQLAVHNFDGRLEVDEAVYKMAVTLLYTSLGPLVTHGGSEIIRSKAHAPLGEVVKETKAGYKIFMHGYRDTYNHRKANQFQWHQVGQRPEDDNKNDYKNMYDFWKGMNAFRLSEYGKIFRVSETVSDEYFRWILPHDHSKLGYIVDEKVMVLLNAGHETFLFEQISLPSGEWKLIANNDKVDHVNGVDYIDYLVLNGNSSVDIFLPPQSLMIWAIQP